MCGYQIQAHVAESWVAMGKLIRLSESLFFHVLNENNDTGENEMRFYL